MSVDSANHGMQIDPGIVHILRNQKKGKGVLENTLAWKLLCLFLITGGGGQKLAKIWLLNMWTVTYYVKKKMQNDITNFRDYSTISWANFELERKISINYCGWVKKIEKEKENRHIKLLIFYCTKFRWGGGIWRNLSFTYKNITFNKADLKRKKWFHVIDVIFNSEPN